jgi:hypothetical protein
LFGCFAGITDPSDFPPTCIPGVRRLASPGRPAAPSATDIYGISRFSRKKVPPMCRVCDRAGPFRDLRYRL